MKRRSSSLNVSGDWLEVNRALNPAEVRQGQHGAGQWPSPPSSRLCSRLNKTLPSHRFTSMLPLSKRPSAPSERMKKLGEERRGGGGEGGKIKTEGGRMAKEVKRRKIGAERKV